MKEAGRKTRDRCHRSRRPQKGMVGGDKGRRGRGKGHRGQILQIWSQCLAKKTDITNDDLLKGGRQMPLVERPP